MGVRVFPSKAGKNINGVAVVHAFGANIPATTDRDGIALAQTTAGAGNLVLNGVAVVAGVYSAGFDGGRKITLYSLGNLSTLTFTVTGKDKDGAAQTEDITGPNATTVTGTKFFQSVTQIAVNGAVGTNVEGGFSASLVALNLSRGSVFHLSPATAEAVLIAPYGSTGSGYTDRISLKITAPATHTFTWADGTTPADVRVYFAGGIEPTVTISGTDWFDLVADGTTDTGDTIWYATVKAQDLKA